jgi:hypothetical protein
VAQKVRKVEQNFMKSEPKPPARRRTAPGSAQIALFSDQMIPTRDGIPLATDIYLPADADAEPLPGPFPVILERTPYGKTTASRSEVDVGMTAPLSRSEVAAFFVKNGYAVVYQDCRGRFGSGGTFTKYLSEAADGWDTCAWIMAQPWCNGRIGTMGLSYAAHTQLALASLGAPGLATMILDSGGFSNAYHSGIRQGGAFELKQATWAFKQAADSETARSDPVRRAALAAEDIRAWFAAMPWREGHSPLRHVPEYERYLFQQWHAANFGPEWQKAGIWAEGFYKRMPDVPVLLLSSWYDAYVRTTFENLAGLTGGGRKSPVHVVMGPWTHGDRTRRVFGDVDFGESAPLDGNVARNWRTLRLAWFERHLKPPPAAKGEPLSPLSYFLMGGGSGRRTKGGKLDHGGTWRQAAAWPPPEARAERWYCHPGGLLSPARPRRDAPAIAYDHDPADPVPTIGGALTSGEPVFVGGAFDQVADPRFLGGSPAALPLAARPDVLVFQSPPLDEDLAIAGPIAVTLNVSTNAPDTDFTAKLIDVHPPTPDDPCGFAMNLTDGILRLRFRSSFEKPRLARPGVIYRIAIEPFATANLFRRGHRIRLDIASSNFPKFDVNPQTGELPADARRSAVATNRLHLDARHASFVVLPVLRAAAATAGRLSSARKRS